MRPPRPTVRELTRRARKARRQFLDRHDRWWWEGKYVTDSRAVPWPLRSVILDGLTDEDRAALVRLERVG